MKKLIVVLFLVTLFVSGALLTAYGQNENKQAPAAKETTGMSIVSLVVGTAVEDRKPVGAAESFPSSTKKVICFLEAKNIAEDMEITFVWINNGKELLKTKMPLKAGSRWRTRADKALYGQKGDWKVEIRNTAGNVLKDAQFKVD
jgi:hypothetical protein